MDTRRAIGAAFFRETFAGCCRKCGCAPSARRGPAATSARPGRDELAFLASARVAATASTSGPVHAILKAPAGRRARRGNADDRSGIQACVACATCRARTRVRRARSSARGRLGGCAPGDPRARAGALHHVPRRPVRRVRACLSRGERALALDAGGPPDPEARGCVGCGVCVPACVTSPSSLRLACLRDETIAD